MKAELVKLLKEYYKITNSRDNELKEIFNNQKTISPHDFEIICEKKLSIAAIGLLKETKFNFKKDRATASCRLRIESGIIQHCDFGCSTWRDISFLGKYSSVPLPFNSIKEAIEQILTILEEVEKKINKDKIYIDIPATKLNIHATYNDTVEQKTVNGMIISMDNTFTIRLKDDEESYDDIRKNLDTDSIYEIGLCALEIRQEELKEEEKLLSDYSDKVDKVLKKYKLYDYIVLAKI